MATHDQDQPLDATLGLRTPGAEGHKYNEEMKHEGEKKSVLRKVKDKAKKIKNAVTGHHHDDHDDDDDNDDHDGDDDDEESVTDPEVHDLPTEPGLGEVASRQPPTSQPAHFDTYDPTSTNDIPIPRETFVHPEVDTSSPMSVDKQGGDYQTFDPSTVRYVPGQEETLGHSRTDIGGPIVSEERPYAPRGTPIQPHDLGVCQGRVSEDLGGVVEPLMDLEEDPHAPKDGGKGGVLPENYETKVSDPTGGGAEEIGVTPILHQLERMKIHDEPPQEKPNTGQDKGLFKPTDQILTGTRDQFFPAPLNLQTTPLVDPEPHDETHEGQSTVQNVASKVGPALASEVESNSPPGGRTEPELEVAVDKGVSVKEYLIEKLKPGQEYLIEKLKPGEDDRALSELITDNLPLNKKMDDPNETAAGKGVLDKIKDNLPLNKKMDDPNETAAGKGVLDKIKDAASSLFGKGDQSSSERGSDNSTTGY